MKGGSGSDSGTQGHSFSFPLPLSTAAVLEEMQGHKKGKERESCLNQTQAMTKQRHGQVASPA